MTGSIELHLFNHVFDPKQISQLDIKHLDLSCKFKLGLLNLYRVNDPASVCSLVTNKLVVSYTPNKIAAFKGNNAFIWRMILGMEESLKHSNWLLLAMAKYETTC